MAHNPTFDTEPGYNSRDGGDRSGYSTPGQYGRQSPALNTDPYQNMASYRQATAGPPAPLPGDVAAGNGKSYRFATTEPIPEDDEEKRSPVEARQVQFGGVGSQGGYASKSQEQTSEGGLKSKRILLIVIALAILFALLWVVFMGLYISQVTMETSPAGSGAETGESKQTTIAAGKLTASTTQTAPPVTTAAPDTISVTKMDEGYNGQDVYKYTMATADNRVTAEVVSLGARLYRLKSPSRDFMRGFTQATDNATELAEDLQGIWHGPVCGETPTMHKVLFEREMTTDNSLRLKATISDVDVIFTYTLHDNGKLMVAVTGTPVGNSVQTRMDICSSNDLNLNPSLSGDVTNNHDLMINADQVYDAATNAWGGVGGLNDFSSTKSVTDPITNTQTNYPNQLTISDAYLLNGPTGVRQAAMVRAPGAEMVIQTNQAVMGLVIDLKGPDYIRLMAKSSPLFNGEPNANRITLKTGSTYEFIITYTIS